MGLSLGFDGFFQAIERAGTASSGTGARVPFRAGGVNRCTDCGSSQWLVGRRLAECGGCGSAVPLADVKFQGANKFHARSGWLRSPAA